MTFLHASYLWALPVAIIPVAIYYLMRFRSLKVNWGSNFVLQRALERHKKKIYWEQIILLGLRTIACLAIVAAFARPLSLAPSSKISGTGISRIILLDASYSMLAGPKDKTRWDDALAGTKALIETWGRGERWSLYAAGSEKPWVVRDEAIDRTEDAWAKLDSVEVVEARVDLAQALNKVMSRYKDQSIEIYIFADDQGQSWKALEGFSLPEETRVELFWIRPSHKEYRNLAVASVRALQQSVLRDHPVRVEAEVRSFATAPVKNAEVELMVDGKFFSKEVIDLLPGQKGRVSFNLKLDTPGSHFVTARTARDELTYDNESAAGLEVLGELEIGVLRDPNRKKKFDSAWEFLRIAQEMQKMEREGEPLFTAAPLRFSLIEDQIPKSEPQAIVLDGGRKLSAELAAWLKAYVQSGGALLLLADDAIAKDNWNNLLGQEGLLPTRLERLRAEALGGEKFLRIEKSGLVEGAMRAFESEELGDISQSRFYAWWDVAKPKADVSVLASFDTGSPYAVRKRVGAGCVVLMTAGLNGRDNNLIARELYLPILYQVFSELHSAALQPRTVLTKQAVYLRSPGENVKAATFGLQNRASRPMATEEKFGVSMLSCPEGVNRSGLGSALLITDQGTERVYIGVQGPRDDSDLRPLPKRELEAIKQRLELVEARSVKELLELLAAKRSGGEWHHYAMLLLMACLLGELWFQRRFA